MNRILARASLIALLLVVAALSGTFVYAAPDASITFIEPNGSDDITGEGPDFFSGVVNDRLDFDNPEEVAFIDSFANVSMANGVWRGTSVGDTASFFPLFPGFSITGQSLESRTGRVYPVNSASYSHLVLKYTANARTSLVVSWMPAGDPYSNAAAIGNSNIYPVQAGVNIIDVDLTAVGGGAGGAGWLSRPQWGGIRVDPARFSNGVTVEMDWMRLVPATGGPTLNATWRCSECRTGFDLFADNDTTASNGVIKLARVDAPTNGQFAVPVGKLAPGNYYLGAMDGTQLIAYSPGTFTVQGGPIIKINSPSSSSGEDFATAVRGQPWDMRSRSAIASTFGIGALSIADGVLTGAATNEDPQVFLINNNGAPIDTARYKYLTYDMYLQNPGNSVFNVERVLWYNNPAQGHATGDIINWYNSWQHNSFDLSRTTMAPLTAQSGWTGTQSVLRIDPSEHPIPTGFKLGPVRLTGDPQTAQGQQMAITWESSSPNGTLSIYIDSQRNDQGQQIAARVSVAAGAYFWTVPASVAPGTYWLRIVADDGYNMTRSYSNVPFIVKPRASGFIDVPSSNPFYPYVDALLRAGIIDGYSDASFQPFANTSRVTLARWVVKARGWLPDLTGAPHFVDVPPSHPDYAYVETAYNHNVLSGYGDRTFRPDATITRGQMSKMISIGMDWDLNTSGAPHFVDVARDNTFFGQIETLFNHGAVNGYGLAGGGLEYRWGNSLTRTQLTKVLAIALGLVN